MTIDSVPFTYNFSFSYITDKAFNGLDYMSYTVGV